MDNIKVIMKEYNDSFAQDKDAARHIREKIIIPNINRDVVILDFTDIDSTTQSFIHALISEIFQIGGEEMLNKFEFKNCSPSVKSLITTVINYSID